jgi:large subunit ribosomal protein L31
MKPEIHPDYKDVKVTCSCGSVFITRSTLGSESLSLEVCAKCHPFYTGTQKLVDAAGRVDRFRQKYGRKTAVKADAIQPEDDKSDEAK